MIQFTTEHQKRLEQLALKMLFSNETLTSKLGQIYTITDLLHTTTITSLRSLKSKIDKEIATLEKQDTWTTEHPNHSLNEQSELINLIIGWKLFNSEQASIERQKEKLQSQIDQLKESIKSPEEKLAELQSQLDSLK